MPALDIIVLLAAISGLVLGYRKGLVKQLGSLVAFLLAVIACRMCGGDVAAYIGSAVFGIDLSNPDPSQSFPSAAIAKILGFGIVFVVVWFGVWFLSRLLHAVVQAVRLGVLNAIAGSVFTCVKFLTVASLILNLWYIVAPGSGWMAARGQLASRVMEIAPALLGMMTDC